MMMYKMYIIIWKNNLKLFFFYDFKINMILKLVKKVLTLPNFGYKIDLILQKKEEDV